ncbi:MAG: PorP/SprF family type IX secretion system membrane protein [Bacteroidetes bacterium]|nr:PorP/SprF family type IX secretion system membrane protein [Bacteroidota bacterium]
MKKRGYLWLCLLWSYSIFAQNIPSPTIYIADNQYLLSSAWAGIGDSYQVRALGQWQWLDVQDAPRTFYLSANGRLSDRSGFGIILSDDENGFTSLRSVTLSYAYHLILDADSYRFLSFGLSYRFSNFNVDTSDFFNLQPDPAVGGDRSLDESNFDIGVLYRANGFFANLNIQDIVERDAADFGAEEPLGISKFNLLAGYEFDWVAGPTGYLVVAPSVNYHYFFGDGRAETDLNLKVTQELRDMSYWGGITARFQSDESDFEALSVTPMLGFKYLNYYFAYGYQSFFTDANDFRTNTHLISIGIDFGGSQSNCICTQVRGIK